MQSKSKDRSTQTHTAAFFKGTTGSAAVYIRSYIHTALPPARNARMPTQMVGQNRDGVIETGMLESCCRLPMREIMRLRIGACAPIRPSSHKASSQA